MSEIMTESGLCGFAQRLAGQFRPGDRVCLAGPLGAGKSTLLRTILVKWQIEAATPFSSPTFSLLNQYQTHLGLVNHADLYRLSSMDELVQSDLLTELSRPDSVNFVEWGDKFPELKSFFNKFVHIDYVPGDLQARIYRLAVC